MLRSLLLGLLLIATGGAATRSSSHSAGAPLFDGRASRMMYLDPIGGESHQSEDPQVWSCLCYVNGDVKLVPDLRYGEAYRYSTDDSSWNGFSYDPGPNAGTSDLGIYRPQGLGHWDWYSLAVKIPRDWVQPTWALVLEVNFPAWTSPPEGLDVSPRTRSGSYCWTYSSACTPWFDLVRNVGPVGATTHEHHWLRRVALGRWTEFVIGIKWAIDDSGQYFVYSRVPGSRKSKFILGAAARKTVTYQTNRNAAIPARTVDLQFLYEGTQPSTGWPSPLWRNTIYQRGFERFATRSAAFASFK